MSEEKSAWENKFFWNPGFNKFALLPLIFFLLVVLRFDEIFGLHMSRKIVFDVLPAHLAYHIGLSLISAVFIYLLYLNWPDTSKKVEEENDDGKNE